jgi:hypothetical protein
VSIAADNQLSMLTCPPPGPSIDELLSFLSTGVSVDSCGGDRPCTFDHCLRRTKTSTIRDNNEQVPWSVFQRREY